LAGDGTQLAEQKYAQAVLFGMNLRMAPTDIHQGLREQETTELKEILLFGRVEREDLICNVMEHAQGYKFRHTSSVNKALKMLEKTSPDYIMVTGNIGQNGDGSYFIDV
jgi:hypothetical protein